MMNFKRIVVSLGVVSIFAASAEGAAPPGNAGEVPVSAQVQEMQEKILGDAGMMSLVQALQDDPEMQALLSDPKIMEAARAGDIGALLSDPRVLNLLDNPQIKEIGKRLEPQNPGKK